MSNSYQNERAYRDALNELRFSEEAKRNIAQNLLNRQQPLKRRTLRPLRLVLITAAVCAALAATAAASQLVLRQANIQFIDSTDEIVLPESQTGIGPEVGIVVGGYNGSWEYKSVADDTADWWNGYGRTLVEEAAGTDEDGWTKMRSFQCLDYLEIKYLGEKLSDFDGLWNGASWDTSWLEEQYTAVLDGQRCYMRSKAGQIKQFSLVGEYQGDGDAVFHLEYLWLSDISSYGDQYVLSTSYDYTELYETADGVAVAIEMATSPSGKSLFWAEFSSGQAHFSMFGAQMELEDIQDILDSLNLSALCEYTAE